MSLIDDLPVAHFEFKTGFGLSKLKYYEQVMVQVEDALKTNGLDKYYVIVGDQKDYDFAVWMGYEVTGQHIDRTNYEVLSKEL